MILSISNNFVHTWQGPHTVPMTFFPSRDGINTGSGQLFSNVSPSCPCSFLPQPYTPPSSVRARQCMGPMAMSITFLSARASTCLG